MDSDILYFAIGSNMLRSKIISRLPSGSASLKSFGPCVAANHALAFDLPAFPPLEPYMASLKAAAGEECHGALCEMSRRDYEALWQSEGGNATIPPYKEVVVDCVPYGGSGEQGVVKAVSLSTRSPSAFGGDPSRRYMDMLVRGAEEVR